jgi:hypothetical protein
MTGIGITVHNRNESAAHTIEQIKKYAPDGCKIVIIDDASKIPFEGADFRFDVNVGISRAKNKCFELLDDCEHIFLFDDDCYPVVHGWEKPYIESGINHLSFTFDRLSNGKQNGNKVILSHENIMVYNNPCGCMCYFTKQCLEVVGGFNPVYKTYGYEHVDLSVRIHNAGLTEYRFMDVPNSIELFYSLDYHCSIVSSVGNSRGMYVRGNKRIYDQMQLSKEFIPYKPIPKIKNGNIVLTSYFNYSNDPQRRKKWSGQIDELKVLINSCIKQKVKLIIFTNCFVDTVNSKYVQFIDTLPSRTHSPNVYRWIVYAQWMNENSFDKAWMVDATDVELLKNPFKTMERGKLYCGDECDMKTDNSWMRKIQEPHFKIADYRKVIEQYASYNLINCGIVGGHHEILVPFIEKWAEIHKTTTVGLTHSTDMAIFNYVARKYYNDFVIQGIEINTRFKYFEYNKVSIWKHK